MSETLSISFVLNGRKTVVDVLPNAVAADVLRDQCRLTSVRVSCDQAVCGVCTILADGVPLTGCSTLAFELDGKEVTTVEGLVSGTGDLHPIQQAFRDRAAFQCGFCTPGMLLSTKALLDHTPSPSREDIRQWMSANVCRCTGYNMIIEAVEVAAAAAADATGEAS